LSGLSRSSPFANAVFVAALSGHQLDLAVRLPPKETPGTQLLRTVFSSDASDGVFLGRARDLTVRAPVRVPGLALLPCDSLPVGSRPAFDRILRDTLRTIHASAAAHIFGGISDLIYELTTNAEEHGRLRPDNSQTQLSCLVLHHIANPKAPWVDSGSQPELKQYFNAYRSHRPPPSDGWLNVLVCDGGSGLTYAWVQQHLGKSPYSQTAEAEAFQLERTVIDSRTTKGARGAVINTATPPGQGLKCVLQRLALLGGFAAVRTGRLHASMSFPSQRLLYEKPSVRDLRLRVESQVPLLGAVWSVMIPLSQQPELALERGP